MKVTVCDVCGRNITGRQKKKHIRVMVIDQDARKKPEYRVAADLCTDCTNRIWSWLEKNAEEDTDGSD